jgi:hypothetical protein
MADAEDLKSSGDFSSWGFDSPPGHQNNPCVCGYLKLTENSSFSNVVNLGGHFYLSLTYRTGFWRFPYVKSILEKALRIRSSGDPR